MMKWKVTRNPRCASADRSSDYLRTIELPDPTLLRSPLGSQHYEKEPLTESKKQSQQGNELFRKPSFTATDCINLKGIFGISKDRNDTAYSSLGLTNPGERQRSRSEVRGASADRFSFAYHENPLVVSQFPFQGIGKDKSKKSSTTKKTRSASPEDKSKGCWVRGRRREREPRKPLLSDEGLKGSRTVVTGTKGPAPHKIVNGRTSVDSSGPRNKQKLKNERSISKEKGNLARGKENKEVNNNDDDKAKTKTENKTVGVLPQNSSSVNKPKRIIRKKGQAPKPQQAQIQKETIIISEKNTCESSRNDPGTHVQPTEGKSGTLKSTFDPSKNMVTNIECNGNPLEEEQTIEKNCENSRNCVRDTHATKVTVRAEVHFESASSNKLFDCIEKTAECGNENYQANKVADKGEIKMHKMFQGFRKAKAPNQKGEYLPVIDEPDYTPSNSDEETGKDIDMKDETLEEETLEEETSENQNKQTMDQYIEGAEDKIQPADHEEALKQSVAEDPNNQTKEIFACEKIVMDAIGSTSTEVLLTKEYEEDEMVNQSMDTTGTVNESSELPLKASSTNSESSSNEECNVSIDDVTDSTELDDATLLDMSSDTLMGFSSTMDDCSPTSPTPPPRKKMASLLQQQLQQLMTVNVVIRNPPPANGTNISLTSPIIKDIPEELMVKKKKSFVLTVAKQEEGFRSLCASRDYLSGGGSEMTETDENRISVTFLCSGPPSESWLDSSSSLTNRMRSVSVPPKNGSTPNQFISLMAAAQRNGSKDKKTKDRQNSKRKSHRGRKKDAVFHMPQAVIDELSQVLETRKRVPDGKLC